MDNFTAKTVKTRRGFDWAYYVSPNWDASSPTLLFVHGFPDHAFMWDEVVAAVRSSPCTAGYKVIVPDALGYGGSAKPTDAAAYALSGISDDLVDVLDAEGVAQVVAIGHDWGAGIVESFTLLNRARVVGLCSVSVAYAAYNPSGQSDHNGQSDGARAATAFEKRFGYSQYPYWDLFTAPDAPALLAANLERTYEALHGQGRDWMRQIFCTPGAFRAYLEGTHTASSSNSNSISNGISNSISNSSSNSSNSTAAGSVTLRPFARSEKRRRQFARFERDGFEAPVQYYVAARRGLLAKPEVLRADMPVLFVGSTDDAVCRHELIEQPRDAGLLPDLEVHVIQDCGHWIPMERPKELAGYLVAWLDKKFGAAAKS